MSVGRVFSHEKEAAFQAAVIELAQMLGWKVAHFRAARTKSGWRTPVAADGAGWPDLVLVRDRVIFAECKTERGKLRPDQAEWVDALCEAGADVYVWRPSGWDEIETTLRRVGPLTERDRTA